MTVPSTPMAFASDACSGGYTTSHPDPRTAIVRPAAESAPRWAAESIPRARPLTTTTPLDANSAPRRSATATPYGEAARDPTTATAGSLNASSEPLVQRTGGGSLMAPRAEGYSSSDHVMATRFACAARRSAPTAAALMGAGWYLALLPVSDRPWTGRLAQIRSSNPAGELPRCSCSPSCSRH